MNKIITRSTKISPVYANAGKLKDIKDYFFKKSNMEELNYLMKSFFDKYAVEDIEPVKYIDLIGSKKKSILGISKNQLSSSGRLKQLHIKALAGQANSILSKISKANKSKKKTKYQTQLLYAWESKELKMPEIKYVDLDYRFFSLSEKNNNSFDIWLVFTLPNNSKKQIAIPMKKTKHMRDLEKRGYQIKPDYVRIYSDNNKIQLVFEKNIVPKTQGNSIGIDIGASSAFSLSSGFIETASKPYLESASCLHWGSKNANRYMKRWENEIDYQIKYNIPWGNIKFMAVEKLTDMKRYKRNGKYLSRWSPTYIMNRIKLTAEEYGISLMEVKPAYTSQRCSSCGNIDKKSRNGKKYKCVECKYEIDADVNGAKNILSRALNEWR